MENSRDSLMQQLQDEESDLQDDESTQVYDVASMPGFRFQPTEEELVGFYLRSMVIGKRLEVELINVLDLYRYDPWELPEMAFMQSEKEWLFFCPRDRKYPNGARPNRVTASGYWKATGTDRQVRRAHDSRCIGFKKTLVFYTGKAPRGRKTEWVMNEYRLPQDEQIVRRPRILKDPREVALCRIYKKPVVLQNAALGHADSTTEDPGVELSTHNPCESSKRRDSSGGLESEQASASTSGTSPSSPPDTLALFRRRSILDDMDMLCDTQDTRSHNIQASCSRSVKLENEPSLSSASRYNSSLAPDNADSIEALLSGQMVEVAARRGRSMFQLDDSPSETRVTNPSDLGVSVSTSADRLSWLSQDDDCAQAVSDDVADLIDQRGCSNLTSQLPSIDRLWALKASLWSPLASNSIFAAKDDDDLDLPLPTSLYSNHLGWGSQQSWLSTISPVRQALLQMQGHSYTSSE